DLMFANVTRINGSQTWTPVNIGVVTDNLIIADLTNGIDIPANEQVEIDITVVLRDTSPQNIAGVTFSNAASYTFNSVNGDDATVSNGLGNTTPVMTIVEPELTMDKRGPAGMVSFLAPIPYTLVVENIGTGPAFDTTIIDRLPAVPDNAPLVGGTCDTTPINIIANIFENDESTLVQALIQGTHYTATYTAAPTCELVITTITDSADPVSAEINATQKLIVTYEATLNVGTQSGALLTNIAGVTQWFSLDTAGAGATGETRTYTRAITNGTPVVIDHEDAFTVTVDAPVLDVQKTVLNVTTGQNPGSAAVPTNVLRYTITINNGGVIAASAVTLSDAIPANASYIADTVMLNGVPVGQPDGGVSPLVAGIDVSSADLTPPLPGVGNGVVSAGQTATVTFDVLLNAAIDSGTVILNQATADSPSTGPMLSDDPNLPGAADPTPTTITSAPAFLIQKVSQDITGDPNLLQPGDVLRYTLTVENIGSEDSINSLLSDQIPANTTYVANSTRLNTVAVADPVAGVSALAAGMLINAPEDTTAGVLRAAVNNVATITFDVRVNLTAVNGTIISNQGFFNGAGVGSGVFPQQPSDDPGTALVNDPTIDVVGNVAVIDALKTVVIQIDGNGNTIVDPGDTLRYTITTSNIGAMPATNIVLTDAVPANTTYVANSTTMNTLAVPDAGAGISPLIAGVAMSSSDLTPPLPAAGNGVLSPANSAIVIFDVVVNAGTVAGTIISNQGFVASNELPTEPTDADGNDGNGDQPTVVVVGNVQQLAITKQVLVIGGGAAEPGKELEYVVRVTNIGSATAVNAVITDDLDVPVAGQMTYVANSGLLNGLPAGINVVGSLITATIGNMPAAAIAELRFRVLLAASLNIGDTVENTAVASWDVPIQQVQATVAIDIGGTPGAASLNGQVWHDIDFSNDVGTGELLLQNYRVELYRSNTLLANIQTDSNGAFQFTGLPPNFAGGAATGAPYELRYIAPGATATTATLGTTNSAFTDGAQRITDIFAGSGITLQNLNLPRQINGIVYDSVLRVPIGGVRLTMINQSQSNQSVPGRCFDDPVHANQVTQVDGYYKFDLNFSDVSVCAENDEYVINVQPPADGFIGTTSVIIPPVVPITSAAFDVPNCPGSAADKIPATAQNCENSTSEIQPPPTIEPRTPGTDYNLKFLFNNVPSTDQIYNNHIAIDGELDAAVAITKVAGKLNVTRSDLVPYTITFNNTLGVPLFDVSIIDNFPAGFKYVAGSARVDGIEIEPQANGLFLTWPSISVGINETRVIKLLLIVGSGVGEGEYVNTARAINTFTGEAISGVASATVRVIPDPTFDCTDVIGKVFNDKNLNGYQDDGETGVPGAQVATAKGLRITTDKHGRFHITCAIVPNEVRGSNFIMKLDDRSLPSGYRVTTENPRVLRATRGKMLKFSFGTAIHRVVRLDLADGVFEKGTTDLRPQWRTRIGMLITELQKEGSVLRLSYLAENESEDEVDDRLEAIEEEISDRWQDLDCCYRLTIETEVFWRKGSPSAGREFKE
ncbi:Conserved repeat domain protein, partial [hydrothermal vent metagenome]